MFKYNVGDCVVATCWNNTRHYGIVTEVCVVISKNFYCIADRNCRLWFGEARVEPATPPQQHEIKLKASGNQVTNELPL